MGGSRGSKSVERTCLDHFVYKTFFNDLSLVYNMAPVKYVYACMHTCMYVARCGATEHAWGRWCCRAHGVMSASLSQLHAACRILCIVCSLDVRNGPEYIKRCVRSPSILIFPSQFVQVLYNCSMASECWNGFRIGRPDAFGQLCI